MAISLTHTTTSAEPDSGDGKISSNAWNEAHTLTMATARMLGRTTAGTGAVEELTAAGVRAFLDLEAGTDFIGIGGGTYTGDVSVPDEAYGSAWNGSVEVPTKNAVYDKIEGDGHPGYIASTWYAVGVETGTGAAGSTMTANTIYLIPFFQPRRVTISDLGARVSTGVASAKFALAIYANDATTGRPTGAALAATGDMDGGSAASVSADITGANVTLEPGWYWRAFWSDSAIAFSSLSRTQGVTYYAAYIGAAAMGNVANSGAVFMWVEATETFNSAAWPASIQGEVFTANGPNSRVYLMGMKAA